MDASDDHGPQRSYRFLDSETHVRHRPFHGTSKIPFEIGLWQGVDGSRIMAVMDAHNYTTKWRYEDLSHSK